MTSTQPKLVELGLGPRKFYLCVPHTFLNTFLKYNQEGARELKSIIKENVSAHIVKVLHSITIFIELIFTLI